MWGGSGAQALAPRQLPWHVPLVFSRGQLFIRGQSAGVFRIGALHLRYQKLKQLVNIASGKSGLPPPPPAQSEFTSEFTGEFI